MTLIEALEAAAREIDCPVSDLCTADDPCTRRPLAARLRTHAKQLRERIAFLRTLDDPRMASWRVQVLGELEYQNHDPVYE